MQKQSNWKHPPEIPKNQQWTRPNDKDQQVYWSKIGYFFYYFAALIFGVICLGLTYVASLLGNILQAALSLFGMLGAPMLGLFTLGMVFPWATYIGAYVGTLVSLVMMLWIGIGAYITKPIFWRAPISTEGCNWNLTLGSDTSRLINSSSVTSTLSSTVASVVNVTSSPVVQPESSPIDRLYTLSYLWYSATALLIVVVVGMVASLITGRQDPKKIDARLICPLFDVLFPYLPDRWRKPFRFGVVHKNKYDFPPTENGEVSQRVTTRTDLLRQSVQLEVEVGGKRKGKLRTPKYGADIDDTD